MQNLQAIDVDEFKTAVHPIDHLVKAKTGGSEGLSQTPPLVADGQRKSNSDVAIYRRSRQAPEVDAIMLRPEVRWPRVLQNETLDGFNFIKNRLPLSKVLEQWRVDAISVAALGRSPKRADVTMPPPSVCRARYAAYTSSRHHSHAFGSAIKSHADAYRWL